MTIIGSTVIFIVYMDCYWWLIWQLQAMYVIFMPHYQVQIRPWTLGLALWHFKEMFVCMHAWCINRWRALCYRPNHTYCGLQISNPPPESQAILIYSDTSIKTKDVKVTALLHYKDMFVCMFVWSYGFSKGKSKECLSPVCGVPCRCRFKPWMLWVCVCVALTSPWSIGALHRQLMHS